MKQFNHSFYTDDFDQEMLDFLKQEGFLVTDNSWNDANIKDVIIRYSDGQEAFWTSSGNVDKSFGVHLTKQEFKKRIGMTKTNGSLKRWKNGDKRLQVETEYLTDEQKVVLKNMFEKLGWATDLYTEFLFTENVWTNTYEHGDIPSTELLHGTDLDPSYPLSTLEDIEEILKYEESKNMKKEDNTFTKDMLKDGMMVKDIGGLVGFVWRGNITFLNGSFLNLYDFNQDLTHKTEPSFNIVGVAELDLKWQRTNPEKLKLLEEVSSVEEEIKTLQERLQGLKIELEEVDGE